MYEILENFVKKNVLVDIFFLLFHFDRQIQCRTDQMQVSNVDNDATSKIDDVLTEHGGLLHVLPLTVHLSFFA